MTSNLLNKLAKAYQVILNPFVIPTLGIIIIMNFLPGLEFYTSKAKLILLSIVFLSTCFLPLLFIAIISKTPGYNKAMPEHRDRIIPYFFTAVSIFMGAQLLAKLPFPSVFRLIMAGTSLILVMLFIVTLWWKISAHMAAMGGLVGMLLALVFKYGMGMLTMVVLTILLSGIMGTCLIYLRKNSPVQVYSGFGASFMVMYIMVYFF